MNKQTIFNSLPVFGLKSPDKVKSYPKAKTMRPEPPGKLKMAKRIRAVSKKRAKEKKENSEFDFFVEIYNERPHVSELSGKPLPYGPDNPAMFVKQFLHVVNKGRSPKWRLNKRNVMMGLPEEHDRQNAFPKFRERLQELTKEMYDSKK